MDLPPLLLGRPERADVPRESIGDRGQSLGQHRGRVDDYGSADIAGLDEGPRDVPVHLVVGHGQCLGTWRPRRRLRHQTPPITPAPAVTTAATTSHQPMPVGSTTLDAAGVEAGLSPFALVAVGATVAVTVGAAVTDTAVLGAAEPVAADVEPRGPGVIVSRMPVPAIFVVGGEVMSNENTTLFCPGSSVHDGSTSPGPVGLPLASRRMTCAAKSLPRVTVAWPG